MRQSSYWQISCLYVCDALAKVIDKAFFYTIVFHATYQKIICFTDIITFWFKPTPRRSVWDDRLRETAHQHGPGVQELREGCVQYTRSERVT